jgi:hypothetical protein
VIVTSITTTMGKITVVVEALKAVEGEISVGTGAKRESLILEQRKNLVVTRHGDSFRKLAESLTGFCTSSRTPTVRADWQKAFRAPSHWSAAILKATG